VSSSRLAVALLSAAGLALPSCGNSGDRSAQPVSPASPTEPVSNAADTIQLQVVRMDRGFGPALVSNAIPLPQGKLMPGNTAHVMVVVAAHELPVYVEALAGTHPDGSARAVLIQFAYAVSAGTPISALLIIGPGVTRTSDRPKTAITWGMPAAVALPKSSAYLVSTEVVGQTVPAATTPLSPRFFRAYDNQFATYADRHWATEAGQWEYDYYDRVLIWYAWWVRTGNPEYWRRGTVDAIAYRDQFIVPNHYQIQPHNAALEGLALHYLLTGDERSRDAVGQVATFFGRIWTPQLDCATCPYPEGRIQARTLTSHYLAWMINAGDSPQSWSALMATDVTKILATQRADGSYRFANWQWGHSNFETGLVHDALIKYYTYVTADPRIPVALKKTLDWMWATQWDAPTQSFKYLSDVTSVGAPTPAPDLNMLIVTGYGWYFAYSGDETYRTRGDAIFAGGVNAAFLDGYKQFNQSYTSSFHYLFLRSPPVSSKKL